MAERADRRRKALPASASTPEGLYVWMRRYLEWLRVHAYSEATVKNRDKALSVFFEWCDGRGISRPAEITKPIVERYQRHLFHLRRADGRPLSLRGQVWRLIPVRAYFKWLAKQNVILSNPASEIELPRAERRLPKYVLTEAEVERVLELVDAGDAHGVRDRAMLETLYSTGMRRSELAQLGVMDVDVERGTVLVHGKGKKDRMIPIGERALAWIDRYIGGARRELVVLPDPGALFLTRFGEAFSPASLTNLVRGYVDQAELGKTGACHLFRHAMATAMLERGADIRFIQEMLGHAELSTTELYTHVSIRKLKEIHTATHPSARLERPQMRSSSAAAKAPALTAEELLARVAAEREDDT